MQHENTPKMTDDISTPLSRNIAKITAAHPVVLQMMSNSFYIAKATAQ